MQPFTCVYLALQRGLVFEDDGFGKLLSSSGLVRKRRNEFEIGPTLDFIRIDEEGVAICDDARDAVRISEQGDVAAAPTHENGFGHLELFEGADADEPRVRADGSAFEL